MNESMHAWTHDWLNENLDTRKERNDNDWMQEQLHERTQQNQAKWNEIQGHEMKGHEVKCNEWKTECEVMKEWRKKGRNKWMKEWMGDECKHEWKKERMNKWMKEWRNESINQWTNESMNQWMRAWMKMKLKMNMKEEANAAMKQWMHMLPTWSSRNFWTPQFLNIDTRIVKCKFWLWELRAPFERYSSVVWATFEPVYRVKCVQRIVMAEVRKYNTFRQKDLLGEKR